MILTRTPFRLSLFGGGTDFPEWFRENRGLCLTMGIDKYCYLSVRRLPPFFHHRNRIVYSRVETVASRDQIQHPVVRAVLTALELDGVEIHHDADLPARSGIGSSSAFTVGLLNACHALKGEYRTHAELAREAIGIERVVLKEKGGWQDQIACSFGGLREISFHDSVFDTSQILLPKERLADLQRHLMLLWTNVARSSFSVQESWTLEASAKALDRLYELAITAGISLRSNAPIRHLGELLHESWAVKRQLSSLVTNDSTDALYARCMGAGAYGGKLVGAGGGGFLLLIVDPEKRSDVREAAGLLEVPFDVAGGGSEIVFGS